MSSVSFLPNENYTVNETSSNSESQSIGEHFEERRIPLIINCALNAPLSLTAIFGNMIVIFSIWKTPSLHSPSNILLLGLAVCDFGVGLTVQPFYIIYTSFYLANHQQTWLASLKVFNVLANLVCGVSFLTTTAVSIDRYIAIHLHLRYRELVTLRGTSLLLVVLWIISAFVASTIIWKQNLAFFLVTSLIVVCLFSTFGVYVRIFIVVRQHQRRIQDQQSRKTRNYGNTTQFAKSAIGMFYVCFVHFLCYVPYFVFLILRDIYQTNTFTILATEYAQTLIFLNSSLNPVVYCWRLGEIRKAVKRSLASLGCKRFENPEGRVITIAEISLKWFRASWQPRRIDWFCNIEPHKW